MSSIDLLFPDRGRAPYYIVAPAHTRFSAGARVLHVLCHLLNQRNQAAFLMPMNPKAEFYVHPDLLTPLLTQQVVDAHFAERRNPVVVYPETLPGNPAGADCVVRFLLNYPGAIGGPKEFPPEELLMWYSAGMREGAHVNDLVLSIPATDARFYSPPPAGSPRRGSCFYAAKYKQFSGLPLSPITHDSIEIPGASSDGPTPSEIADLFRRSEVFYCYEASALSLEAMLCGCPVVLIPSPYFNKPILLEQFGWTGMAWGNAPEEVERARKTVGEVRAKYHAWADRTLEQLEEFIALTQAKARGLPYNHKITLIGAPQPESKLKQTLRSFVPPALFTARWKIKESLARARKKKP